MAIKISGGNERRAEVIAEGLRDKPVKFKATFNAQCTVESRLNMGMLALLDRVGTSEARFREMAVVLEEFSEAGGSRLTEAEVEQLVVDDFKSGWALYVELLLTVFGKAKKVDAGKVDAPPTS